jgi:hypothetical protein
MEERQRNRSEGALRRGRGQPQKASRPLSLGSGSTGKEALERMGVKFRKKGDPSKPTSPADVSRQGKSGDAVKPDAGKPPEKWKDGEAATEEFEFEYQKMTSKSVQKVEYVEKPPTKVTYAMAGVWGLLLVVIAVLSIVKAISL